MQTLNELLDEIIKQNESRQTPGELWIVSKEQRGIMRAASYYSPTVGQIPVPMPETVEELIESEKPEANMVMGHPTVIVPDHELHMTNEEICEERYGNILLSERESNLFKRLVPTRTDEEQKLRAEIIRKSLDPPCRKIAEALLDDIVDLLKKIHGVSSCSPSH